MFLERNDVDPNQGNFFGETPLAVASTKGHEGIVKMLLERNDLDPRASVPHWSLSALPLALLICVLFLIHIAFSYLRVSLIEFVFICITI